MMRNKNVTNLSVAYLPAMVAVTLLLGSYMAIDTDNWSWIFLGWIIILFLIFKNKSFCEVFSKWKCISTTLFLLSIIVMVIPKLVFDANYSVWVLHLANIINGFWAVFIGVLIAVFYNEKTLTKLGWHVVE